MSEIIINTVLSLGALGLIAALVLYVVSKRFKVFEDPKIGEVEEALPSTNCGGCGYPGCHSFAEACVKKADLNDLHCPVGGNEVMKEVAGILGIEAVEKDPYIAVVRCSGSFEHRNKTNIYDGAPDCSIAAKLYSGDTGCAYGCLGLGECVDACDFDAMYMDEKTGLPVVIEDACTACNACVTTCPKDILQLWPQGKKNRRIYVACINEEKGAKKNCSVACIGCSKCVDDCKFDAITVENNLAYIDYEKCKLCRKCVDTCPTDAIHEYNFPAKRSKPARTAKSKKPVAAGSKQEDQVDVISMIKKRDLGNEKEDQPKNNNTEDK